MHYGFKSTIHPICMAVCYTPSLAITTPADAAKNSWFASTTSRKRYQTPPQTKMAICCILPKFRTACWAPVETKSPVLCVAQTRVLQSMSGVCMCVCVGVGVYIKSFQFLDGAKRRVLSCTPQFTLELWQGELFVFQTTSKLFMY